MNPRFDHPEYLALALLALPMLWLGWRATETHDTFRRIVVMTLRTIMLVALAVMLASPHLERRHHHVTVIGVLDISGSVQRFANVSDQRSAVSGQRSAPGFAGMAFDAEANPHEQSSIAPGNHQSSIEYLRRWFRHAVQLKEPDDRFGLIVFDGRSVAVSVPSRNEKYTDDNLDVPMMDGTNIADAIRLGLAMFPADTAKRLVLVTDGNETAGDALEAARMAAAGNETSKRPNVKTSKADAALSLDVSTLGRLDVSVPIDVLPVAYRVTGDVQVVRVETPPTAQPNQTVTVRVILEATQATAGSLILKREGVVMDVNGAQPGTSRHVELPQGQSVQIAQVTLGETPINRFEAVFEPDDPKADVLPDNDRAEAFTATPSKGSVLIVDRRAGQRTGMLNQMLREAKIPATSQAPGGFPTDLLSLQNYDLIVLDDIAASELATPQQELIARYVTDLGGGLIMTGGENSFGAGGWNHTPIAEILPLELDPPKELRLPTAALVLVLDKSGSMNQSVAGARASKQQVAVEGAALAIQSLRSDSLVGVISFDMFTHEVVPLQRNDNPKQLANTVRGVMAEGGTNMGPALRRAMDMLKDQQVNKKRVVCLTDGRSEGSNEAMEAIAKAMSDANIQLTTIAVGDDADHELLQKLAEVGGGEFYPVRDPRILPRVLVDSVQVINKPLIKEGPFTPRVLATGSTLTAGLDQAPPLKGIVITGARSDARASLEMLDESNDPLFAHWQIGLGRVAAFTSQAPGSGAWSSAWTDWPGAAMFWTQLARTISRPAMNPDAELIVTIQDDRLAVSLELTGDDAAASYAQVEGTVYSPDGRSAPVRLRQTAPGRFEGGADAAQAGNYIVALNPRQGQRRLSPVIGGASKSTSPEFRTYHSNLGLLEQIVEVTGGRRLDVRDPQAVDLFDRQTLPWSVSSLPAWRWVLWLAIAVMLLDVTARRIAWSEETLRRAVRNAIARVTPSHVRGAKAAATLATLRRVSVEVDQRYEREAQGVEKFESTGEILPPPERIDESAIGPIHNRDADRSMSTTSPRREPDPSKVAAAIDALLGRKKVGESLKKAAPPSDTSNKAAETTGNLLAAKRRARERLNPDSPHDRKGG